MRKIFRLLFSITLLWGGFQNGSSQSAGTWTYYPSDDRLYHRLFDTPETFYILSYAQPWRPLMPENSEPQGFLYALDKESGELRHIGDKAGLSRNILLDAEYNAASRYLMLIYEDGTVDLLHDDGSVDTLSEFMASSAVGDKHVNSITFDPANNKAYLATNFGYLVIDDKKVEISESRIYNRPLNAVTVAGDEILVADGEGGLYRASKNSPRMLWSDYEQIPDVAGATELLPLGDTLCGVMTTVGKQSALMLLDLGGTTPEVKQLRTMSNYTLSQNARGYLVGAGNRILQLDKDGTFEMAYPDADDMYIPVSSWNFDEFFFGADGKGFYSKKGKTENYATEWSVTRREATVGGPATFLSNNLYYSPTYGMMVATHGLDNNFTSEGFWDGLQLSALKDGEWKNYGFAWTNPEQLNAFSTPTGPVEDPDNPSVFYFGSDFTGLLRINLERPQDVLHLSKVDDQWKDLPGFVEVHPEIEDWKRLSSFSTPSFDSEGNMYTLFYIHNADRTAQGQAEIWVWPAASRRASTTAANYKPMTKLTVGSFYPTIAGEVMVLESSANQGLIAIHSGLNQLCIYDTGGSPTNSRDDKKGILSNENLKDNEGQSVPGGKITCLYEDPNSGLLWVGTDGGLFATTPRSILAGNPSVTQFKIARNDGTSLADYLLNDVSISDITTDDRGRKWISTMGAGLVCVSSDGREVIRTLNTDNSDIPSDNVYRSLYSPETQSFMVSTDKGLAEYRPYTVGDGTDFDYARAYPNPVRPDYLGYVTIDGLVDNSIVKIVDAHGRLVRELGFAAGGSVSWDVCNMNHRRVGSGVYYVLASSGPEDESMSKATKILVVN